VAVRGLRDLDRAIGGNFVLSMGGSIARHIKGSAAITFNDDRNSDSERLRILISMTLWAIWKSRNKNTINSQDVVPNETIEILKDMISSLIRNSWIATKFMEPTRKMKRQRKLRSLWGDGNFVDFDANPYPTINFS